MVRRDQSRRLVALIHSPVLLTSDTNPKPPAHDGDALPSERPLRLTAAAAFVIAGGLATAYALQGGAYDTLVRQQAGLLVWLALAAGLATGVLPRSRPRRGAWVLIGGLASFVLVTALSLAWTESAERTIAEVARNLGYLGIVLLVLCSADRRTVPAACAGLVSAGVLVCGLALASRLAPAAFPADTIGRVFETSRLSYPLNYWNGLATWAAIAIAGCLSWSVHARAPAARAVALAGVPLCAAVVFLTYSRAGAVGIVLATAAVLALGPRRVTTLVHIVAAGAASAIAIAVLHGQKAIADATGTQGAWLVVVALLAAALVAGAAPLVTSRFPAPIRRRPAIARRTKLIGLVGALTGVAIVLLASGAAERSWDEFRQPAHTRIDDPADRLGTLSGYRYAIWSSAIDAFRAHPWGGTGGGTFEFWWNRGGGAAYLRDAHSLYLQALAELGIFGLLAILVAVAGALTVAVRARARLALPNEIAATTALIAMFVVFLFHVGVDWIWQVTAVGFVGLTAAALAANADREPVRSTRTALQPSGMGARLRALVVIGAVALAVVQLPGVAAETRLRDSQAAFTQGDFRRAALLAGEAADATPWAATPVVQRALAEEAQGQPANALGDMRRAANAEPTNWKHPFLAARLHAQLGDAGAALAARRRAHEMRPESAFSEADLDDLPRGSSR